MQFVTALGNNETQMLLAIILLLVPRRRYRLAGLAMCAAFVLGHGVVDVLKELIARPRPFQALDWVHRLSPASGFSFPSGHTAGAFLMAYVLGWSFRDYKWYFYGLAGLIGISRLYVGVHYPSDVLVGGLIGWGSAWVVVYVVRQIVGNEGGYQRPQFGRYGGQQNHHHHHDRNHNRHEFRREQGKVVKQPRQESGAPVPAPAAPKNVDAAGKPQQRHHGRPRFSRGRRNGRPAGNNPQGQNRPPQASAPQAPAAQ